VKKQLLIIGFVWPEPKSSAAGSRILQLIELFQNFDYNVHFVSSAKRTEKTFDLESIDVSTDSVALNDSSFDDFIINLKPDVVLFDRFMTEEQFGWRVAQFCPFALRILDTEDFHGLRKGRQTAFEQKEEFSLAKLQNDTTKREVASIYRCDLSLMISQAEIDILTQDLKIDKQLLHYLPFVLDANKVMDYNQLPRFNERQHFVTIGNFRHPPNFDAVVYLKEDIWPRIRKTLPEAVLHIYGAYASKKVEQLHNDKEGFLIKGFAEDVNEVMQKARVCLAPLRFGAGLKGKLMDAMQNGIPCVMTSIAAEGMFGTLPANGMIVDDASAFAKASVELYTDADLWNQMSKNGFAVLKSRFDQKEHAKSFHTALNKLTQGLKEHRQQNFIGQMLQHHTLQSTKYMSRWIEEKNKNQN
jgi:glycosyltransferase involved in cell wall biosynthesis